jgi:pantothenate kinase type III
MQSGVVIGYRSLTIGLLERVRFELSRAEKVEPSEVQVVLTGGLARGPWSRDLPGIDAVDVDLTLKGLGILWAIAAGEPEVPGEDRVAWTGSAAGTIHAIPDPHL